MHLLAYVQTSRITGWKNMVHGCGREAMVYGSKDRALFTRLKRGDVLWVIASSKGHNPTLVARIVVEASGDSSCPEVVKNPGALALLEDDRGRFPHVVIGGSDSAFFGHNDAGSALLDLTLQTSTGREIRFRDKAVKWESELGHYLQRPIQIAETRGRHGLELLAEQCQKRTVFISWKHRDHPRDRFPLGVARALVEHGFSVWFDLLALPASKYLGEVRRDRNVLTNLLSYGYRQSRFLLAIDSEWYGTVSRKSSSNWTLDEWTGALDPSKRVKRIRVAALQNKHPSVAVDADRTIYSKSPEDIARTLAKLVL